MLINNSIINDIIRVDDYLLFLTLDGLLIFNLRTETWFHEKQFLGSYNKALWNVSFNNEKLYFGTESGIIICDYKIMNNQFKIYRNDIILNNSEIYDITNYNDDIYFCSNNGVFQYNYQLESVSLLDPHIYYHIKILDSNIIVSNNNLWQLNMPGRTLISSNVNIFDIANQKICATDLNELKIIDFDNGYEWYVDLSKLNNKSLFYSLDCDREWLWFTNSKGISFFNWSIYYK